MQTLKTLAIVVLMTMAAPVEGHASMAFEDNKLNFKNCDGVALTARWRGAKVSLASPGKSLGDDHKYITYRDWSGACRKAAWNVDRAKFSIKSDNSETVSATLNYVAPDGSKWVGLRAGDGFFVARVAQEAETITSDRMQEIAAWLSRTSKEFTPGAELAVHLKTVPAQ